MKNMVIKNTIYLYFRMMVLLIVSLFTTRLILKLLGIVDFGIYNVVGGLVTSVSFISASMTLSVQRFIAYEIGRKNFSRIKLIFSTSINIHILISIILIFFLETIGYWFLNNHLNIPNDRKFASNVIYQFSILSLVINVLTVPFNAIILSYERFKFFTVLGFIEAFLKVFFIYLLYNYHGDNLILYSVIIFVINIIILLMHIIYIYKYIKECYYIKYYNKSYFIKLVTFAGWNLWGNIASVGYVQGLNILLNIFFGPLINSARAISIQLSNAICGFVSNFQVALRPQMIKSYSNNDLTDVNNLLFIGTRLSFLLMVILCLPIIINIDTILKLWLDDVPIYTSIFCKLILIEAIVNSLSSTLIIGVQATGKIKRYQTIVGGILLLNIPISYIILLYLKSPLIPFIVSICLSSSAFIIRLLIVNQLLNFGIKNFIKEVLVRIIYVSFIIIIIYQLYKLITINTFFELIFCNISLLALIIITIYFVGLKNQEKSIIQKKGQKFIKNIW